MALTYDFNEKYNKLHENIAQIDWQSSFFSRFYFTKLSMMFFVCCFHIAGRFGWLVKIEAHENQSGLFAFFGTYVVAFIGLNDTKASNNNSLWYLLEMRIRESVQYKRIEDLGLGGKTDII